MNTKKKTLYDILAVSPTATQLQIQTTYDSLLAGLRAQRPLFSAEDYRLKLQIIELAFATLASPTSRAAYDAELAQQPVQAGLVSNHLAVTVAADPVSIALRAEAMSLRAEAISLRADALSVQSEAGIFSATGNRASAGLGGMGGFMPGLRKFLMLVGAVVAVWMVIQVVFLFSSNRRGEGDAAAALKASEKAMLQEYYQTHGVRVTSQAEIAQLEAENRRKSVESRAAERAERAALKAEDDSKRFEEDSRRQARDVSAELGFAENQAKEQARRDDEQKKYQLEEKARRAEDAEINRIEREKQKWADTLRR